MASSISGVRTHIVVEPKSIQNHQLLLNIGLPLLTSLGVSIAWLCWLIDVESLRGWLNEDWLRFVGFAANIVFSIGIVRLLDRHLFKESLRGPLTYFIVINLLGLLFSLVDSYNLNRLVDSLFLLIPNALSSVLVTMLMSFAYFYLANAIKKMESHLFRGYQRPLMYGLCVCGFFSLIVIFKPAIALSLIFVKIIILIIMAASTTRFGFFNIAGKNYLSASLVIIGLVLPFAAYGKAPFQVLSAIGVAVGSFTVSLATILITDDNEDYSITHPKSGAEEIVTNVLKTTRIFNDQWLLGTNDRLAITDTELLRSNDGGITWQTEKQLAFTGEAIQFDQTGQRGWVGNRYSGIEITEDAGKSWYQLTPESAFKQATGKDLKHDSYYSVSYFHLNPETGAGSFTAECSYYFTSDFAKTWESHSFIKDDGKKACLMDTPFSVDTELGLALVKGFLQEQLYRYNESKDVWEGICDLPGSELGTNYCKDNTSLNSAERQFVEQGMYESNAYGGTRPVGRSREIINRYGEHQISNMIRPPNTTGNVHWFADQGYMVTSEDEGQTWRTEQNAKRFNHVIPVSTDVAFAWNYVDTLWISRNSGNTWQRFLNDEPYAALDIAVSNNGKQLWVLYPYKLVRIDTQKLEATDVHSWKRATFNEVESVNKGRVIWAFKDGGEYATVSFDAGETWHDFQASKVQRSNSTGWAVTKIDAMYCASDSPTCFLLNENSTLSEITLANGKLLLTSPVNIRLPELTAEYDEPSFEDIAVNRTGDQIVIVPDTGRHVYVSEDRGMNWTKTSVGSESEWWVPLEVSGDGKTLALKRDKGLSISHDFGKSWHLAKIKFDDYSEWQYCWNHDAQTIYIYDQEYLAVSTNGGANWAEYDEEQFVDPWCGIGNGWLWLKRFDIEISATGASNE